MPATGKTRIRLGLFIVLLLYVLVYGALLIATNGLPYVFDNNETFSSIVHAQNILTYGIDESYGLTDESYGHTPESHPYVYTHQGNFPRFFALLIYWLGAHSGEAQIVVTTFTVGIAAICFAYDLIARRSNWAVGVLFCALMMTDYVMVAQWQVVTWRVWHMFFFFLSLLCVDRAATSDRPRPWLVLLLVTHVALFYFELIFAAFMAATTGIFAILTFRRRLRLTMGCIAAQAAGMVLGIGLLITQLWAFFGWDDFVTDIKLTFLARNEALDEGARTAAEKFMIEHKIAFWYNINELVGLREPRVMLEKFFSLTLGIYTPALVTVAVIVTISILMLRLSRTPSISRRFSSTLLPFSVARIVVGGLFSAYAVLVIIGAGTSALEGVGAGSFQVMLLGLLGLVITHSLVGDVRRHAVSERVAFSAFAPQAITIILAILWLTGTESFYGSLASYRGNLNSLWLATANTIGAFFIQLMLLLAGWMVMRISAGQISSAIMPTIMGSGRLLTIVASGLLAYTIVWLLSPGYIMTGYLNRFVPFVTFVNLLSVAIGITAILAVTYGDIVSLRLRPWWRALMYRNKDGIRVKPLADVAVIESIMLLASTVGVACIPVYWAVVQATYIQRLPPDAYSFLPLLRQPPFKGASFASNTYALPIAVQTGQWVYLDPLLGHRRLETVDGKTTLARDFRYLWLADRADNPAYLTPDYFLCVMVKGIGVAMRPDIRNSGGCSYMPLVRNAGETIPGILTTELVAHDESGRDRWAILRLDWHQAATEPAADTSSNMSASEDRPHD